MKILLGICFLFAFHFAHAGSIGHSIESVKLSPGLHFDENSSKTFSTLTEAQSFANLSGLQEATLRIDMKLASSDCSYNLPALSFGFIYDQDRTKLNGQIIGSTGNPELSKRRLSLVPRVYPIPTQLLNCPGQNVLELSLKRILGGWIGPFAGSVELGELHELQEKALVTEAIGPLLQRDIGVLLLAISILLISLFYRYPDNYRQTAFVVFALSSSILCLSLSGWYYRYSNFPHINFRLHFAFISSALATQLLFIAAYRGMTWAKFVSKRLVLLGALSVFLLESFLVSSVSTLLSIYLFQLLVLMGISWVAYLSPVFLQRRYKFDDRNIWIEISLFVIHFGCSMDVARIWKLHTFENISPYTYGIGIFVIGSTLASELVKVFQKAAQTAESQARLEQSERQTEFARQVGHDIRSPLAALNMVVTAVKDVPEQQRLVMRGAAQRINDIANSLLEHKWINQHPSGILHNSESEQELGIVMLSSLIDSIVSEKRGQYRNRHDVEIDIDLSKGYGLFSKINSTNISRAVSNIIDNSIEASNGRPSKILVSISGDSENHVVVKDNGKGIPKEIISHLGVRGASFGKSQGSGLGLYQAKNSVETANGSLKIESEIEKGTTVTLSFPICTAPDWFLERLVVPENSMLVSIDDDSTVHQIWESRLSIMNNQCIDHIAFTSIAQFEKWFQNNRHADAKFLVDFEFIGHCDNGLDVIERLELQNRAILVSSRAEDSNIQSRAINIGLKVLPKPFAPLIPIEIQIDKKSFSIVQ